MGPKKPPRSNRPKDSAFDHAKNSRSNRVLSHASTSSTAPADSAAFSLPIELQQRILNVFARAFPLAASNADLKSTIQELKGHLYNRDFAAAFGKQEYLAAYAVRWSAARALAYFDIFVRLDAEHHWPKKVESKSEDDKTLKVACIGGGAGAETIAFAALCSHVQLSSIEVRAVDTADWSQCLDSLAQSINTPPPLSKYASESVKAINKPLLDSNQFKVHFTRGDVLQQEIVDFNKLLEGVGIITIMFTLNELFSASISQTTMLLLKMTDVVAPSTQLVVVDSPGSYSEIALGRDTESKKYPMKWLLDHTLLEVAGEDVNGISKWTKLVNEDSRWFRLDSKLKYPIDLEDMRYQIHAYQRGGGTYEDKIR